MSKGFSEVDPLSWNMIPNAGRKCFGLVPYPKCVMLWLIERATNGESLIGPQLKGVESYWPFPQPWIRSQDNWKSFVPNLMEHTLALLQENHTHRTSFSECWPKLCHRELFLFNPESGKCMVAKTRRKNYFIYGSLTHTGAPKYRKSSTIKREIQRIRSSVQLASL